MTELENPTLTEMSALHEEHCSLIQYNLFNSYYPNIYTRALKEFQSRTYELPYHTYYLVFQPLKARYAKNIEKYSNDIKNLERTLRNRLKYKQILITREIDAQQIHYNVVITTDQNIIQYNKKAFNRNYGVHVQLCDSRKDQEKVLAYCFKEAKVRRFRSIDHFQYTK